jgi:rhodanese-related sulfurtransferase
MDPQRLLPLVGAYNFRDLGGYPTTDSRRTRWGRLFRSDTLNELTEEDVATLRAMGLATVVDLRTPTEVERAGPGPLQRHPIHHLHAPVLTDQGQEDRAAPQLRDGNAGDRYLWYLEGGSAALAEAMVLMTEADRYPLVFHCFAGKDRTGVLAALVLDCIGVERTAIVEDYVLTATRMELIIGRVRRDPLVGDRVDEIPASAFAVLATSMERFLEGLDERHGGARQWALDSGLSTDDLDKLQVLLVE